jgi:hypothetical protein
MTNKCYLLAASATVLALSLCGCRVETNTESVPEAEGSGKKAINIRVEPMSRDEIKDATNKAIDKTAEVASKSRDMATSAVRNAESFGKAVTTLTDTMVNINTPAEQAEQVTTTVKVTSETQ